MLQLCMSDSTIIGISTTMYSILCISKTFHSLMLKVHADVYYIMCMGKVNK